MNDSNQKEHTCKKSTYLLLLIFLGFTGAHKFYSKNYVKASLYIAIMCISLIIMLGVHLATEYYTANWKGLTYDDVVTTVCHCNELDYDCERRCRARQVLLAALSGPIGDLLYMIPIFIILFCCFVDFLIVIFKKSDKDGYITF